MSLFFKTLEGPRKEKITLSAAKLTFGRSKKCEQKFSDEKMSKLHCRLKINERTIEVEDLDSSNGIFVNGKKVQTASMQPGDNIAIGSYVFELCEE